MSYERKKRLSIERRGNNGREYAYRTTYYYDRVTRKNVTENKEYLGPVIGRYDNGEPIIREPRNNQASSITTKLLRHIHTADWTPRLKHNRDEAEAISVLRSLIEEPKAGLVPLLRGSKTFPLTPRSCEELLNQSGVGLFVTVSAVLPISGLMMFLKNSPPETSQISALHNSVFLHLLLKESERLPQFATLSNGPYAPWRAKLKADKRPHSVLFLDPSRSLAEVSRNQGDLEFIGRFLPASTADTQRSEMLMASLDSSASRAKAPTIVSCESDSRWCIAYGYRKTRSVDVPQLTLSPGELNDLTHTLGAAFQDAFRWSQAETAELKAGIGEVGVALDWVIEALRVVGGGELRGVF